MKERYQEAEIEVIELPVQDVVRTSGDDGGVDLPFVPLDL